MKIQDARVGMQVRFGRKNGEKTLGVIEAINPKKAKVRTLEVRGKRETSGEVWSVPYVLMEPADGEAPGIKIPNALPPIPPIKPTSHRMVDDALIEAVAVMKDVYGHLDSDERDDEIANRLLKAINNGQKALVLARLV